MFDGFPVAVRSPVFAIMMNAALSRATRFMASFGDTSGDTYVLSVWSGGQAPGDAPHSILLANQGTYAR